MEGGGGSKSKVVRRKPAFRPDLDRTHQTLPSTGERLRHRPDPKSPLMAFSELLFPVALNDADAQRQRRPRYSSNAALIRYKLLPRRQIVSQRLTASPIVPTTHTHSINHAPARRRCLYPLKPSNCHSLPLVPLLYSGSSFDGAAQQAWIDFKVHRQILGCGDAFQPSENLRRKSSSGRPNMALLSVYLGFSAYRDCIPWIRGLLAMFCRMRQSSLNLGKREWASQRSPDQVSWPLKEMCISDRCVQST